MVMKLKWRKQKMNNMTTLINGIPATQEEEKQMEKEAYFREQNIKSLYAKLYSLGLNSEQIRSKLDKMSMFFGHIGSVSNMSDDELSAVSHMIDELIVKGYKFTR